MDMDFEKLKLNEGDMLVVSVDVSHLGKIKGEAYMAKLAKEIKKQIPNNKIWVKPSYIDLCVVGADKDIILTK